MRRSLLPNFVPEDFWFALHQIAFECTALLSCIFSFLKMICGLLGKLFIAVINSIQSSRTIEYI